MTKVIHFCEGDLALQNFVIPICKQCNSHAIIYASKIKRSSLYSARVHILPSYVRLGIKKAGDLLYVLPTFVFLLLILTKLRPFQVVSHMTLNSPLVLLASFLSKVEKRVYFNHGFSFLGYKKGLVRFYLLFFEYINFMLASCVITVSPTQCKAVKSIIFPKLNKLNSTYPGSCAGLPLSFYLSEKSLDAKLRRLADPAIPISITYIGRPVKRKGFPFVLHIIKAIDQLCQEQYSFDAKIIFNLTLIGINKENAVANLGSEWINSIERTCIEFVEFTNDVSHFLSQSAIMILPSLHEGFGYAYLEAAANGNCLIGYDIPGPDSLLFANINSRVFPLGTDCKVFGETLLNLYANRQELLLMMKNSHKISFQFEQSLVLGSLDGLI